MTRPSSQELEAYLAATFYRRSCPSPDELGEYQLGLLDRKRTGTITSHLAECPHCARELAQLQSFLLDDLAPETRPSAAKAVPGRVHVAVGRLVSGARDLLLPSQPAFAPVYAGMRGGGGEPAVYKAEEMQVVAGAQPDAAAPDRRVLLGLVTGIDPTAWTAHLWQSGTLIAEAALDDGGNFSVSGLAPGSCELVLAGPSREIYIEELAI